jgi:glycosyltransferase involved in cell wall biosynthesis
MSIKSKTCVISCPIDTYSGYGGRSRDIAKALINVYPDWDIKILSQRWGNTRFGYLEAHKEDELTSRVISKIESRPDIWIQITVPNEFQSVGQFNIGITAGIETTVADYSWIEGCNRMNLNLVSSKHSKDVLTQYTYELKNNETGAVTVVKCTSPVEVLFEGLDLTKYYPATELPESEMSKALDTIQEDFCFLTVGHWLQGDFGQDRKNMGGTIKAFLEAFKDKPAPPALILKTQTANASIMDRDTILDKIEEAKSKVSAKNLPNIYLLHGEVSDEDMNHLYNHPKVRAMTTLFKGEGFGRPLLEFAAVNKPILSSFWSGPVDFLDNEFTYFIGGKLELIHKSAQVSKMLLGNSQWFTANELEAVKVYKQIYSDYKKALVQAKRQGHKVRTNFSLEKMSEQLKTYIDSSIKTVPFQIPLDLLNLPNLKKIS